jgi:N(2)-fixation sustaining protein CowN
MSETVTRDRYVSFCNIDCDRNAKQVIDCVFRLIDDPDKTNVFWEYFRGRVASGKHDNLYLLHCHLQNVRELFEDHADEEGLRLLDQLESECM